jgi:D-glucosaminate-6-phosphate ammonia-lyase
MLRAVEVWRGGRDLMADFREWESWYAELSQQITKTPGVRTQVHGPARGGPFPTLSVSWDPATIGLTAHEVGKLLLDGEPRIMTHAAGEGHEFAIRPVAMKPGEYKIVATRLSEIFSSAPNTQKKKPEPGRPAVDLSGAWDVEVTYEVGSSNHKLFLTANGNKVTGSHEGWAYQGDLRGEIDGDRVRMRSSIPAEGTHLSYTFTGSVSGTSMSGDVDLGEYGKARWKALRHG